MISGPLAGFFAALQYHELRMLKCLVLKSESDFEKMNPRAGFYRRVIDSSLLDRTSSILVLAASATDKSVFAGLGFSNVTFSNVDDYSGGAADFAPFPFSQQDAEDLRLEAGSFDYVVIHAALHHCHSPHRALLEMYRVACKGVVAFEARDSTVMRLLVWLGLTETFEHTAVYLHGGKAGGVRNGPLPNFIYRWTEREVEKTVDCFAPHAIHSYSYHYGHDAPALLLVPGRSAKKTLLRCLYAGYLLIVRLFRRQQNLFAFMVTKSKLPDGSRPWVRWEGDTPKFDMAWGHRRFGNAYKE